MTGAISANAEDKIHKGAASPWTERMLDTASKIFGTENATARGVATTKLRKLFEFFYVPCHASFTKRDWCLIVILPLWSFLFLLILPWIVEPIPIILALSLLIPFAFVFHLVEHHVSSLWFVLVLFVHIGGVADILSDCMLLGKMMKFWFTKKVDHDEYFTEEWESILFGLRVLITALAGLPGFKIVWGSKKNGNSLILICMSLIWKCAMMGIRILLVFMIAATLITERKLSHKFLNFVGVMELYLLLDFFWSGLPLGVITLTELIFQSQTEKFYFDSVKIWEIVKLCALLIDAIAFSFLIYFKILRIGD